MIGECWQVDRWNKTPQKITIVKETEDTFTTAKKDWQGTMREWKSMKASTNIFATWDAAKAWMIEQAEESLEYAKREVDRKRSELETIKQLHESRLGRGGARLGRRGVPLPEVGAERARGKEVPMAMLKACHRLKIIFGATVSTRESALREIAASYGYTVKGE
jgi:hypothetical protein